MRNKLKSNNPVAIGALLCVLAGIIARTIMLVMQGSAQPGSTAAAPVVQPTRVAIPAAQPAASPTPPMVTTAVLTTPAPLQETAAVASDKNPFSYKGTVAPTATPHPATSDPIKSAAFGKLPAISDIRPLPLLTNPQAQTSSSPEAAGSKLVPGGAPDAAPDPLQALRLTAVIGGSRPAAVLQPPDGAPLVVHVGDLVASGRVKQIQDQAVVFDTGKGPVKLTMQWSSGAAAAASPPDADTASKEPDNAKQ